MIKLAIAPWDASIMDGEYDMGAGVGDGGASSGKYTGDNSANRAIPHGLGVVPKMVKLLHINNGGVIIIMGDTNKTHYHNQTNTYTYDITAMDAVNFYVGNAAGYAYSANALTFEYNWVALP